MDTALVVAALVVVLVLGVIVVLALLIGYIVRVCVARARSQDMPVMVERFTGLIGALERYTPRHQGARELSAPLRGAQLGQQGGAPIPASAPQPAVIPGQVVGAGTVAPPTSGAQ
ncbi:hypothetical protein ACW14Y_42825 (plasmid) [Kitasatospora sp. cg17-2]